MPLDESSQCTIPAGNYMFKVTIETLAQDVKYVQNQNDPIGVVLVSLLFTLIIFRTLF